MENNFNENELFYKTICEKYIKTMSKEMLLEINNKIIHIYIEDKYIDLKYEGKINTNNYQNYLDLNFEVYDYKSYQDLFFSVIKDEIAYDVNDLGLFDEDNKWNFYITFDELKKIGYGFMVQYQYPLIVKYGVAEKNLFDFFKHFSLEQLDNFEHSLHLYYNTNQIEFDEDSGTLISKEDFNIDILRLSCGLTSYEDFIKDYEPKEISKYDILLLAVTSYFKDNNRQLKDYSDDINDNVYHFSDMYKDLINKLNIKYICIFTEEKEPGEYTTTIEFDNNNRVTVDTKTSNEINTVVHNLLSISTQYEEWTKNQKESEIELDY